jgi:hypothetical protein
METILTTASGRRWVRLETQEDADQEGALIETAVAIFFQSDIEKGLTAGWYALRNAAGEQENSCLTVRVPPAAHPGGVGRDMLDSPVACGFRNSNPFEHFAPDIAELAAHIGIPLPRSSYPYDAHRRSRADDDAPLPTP